VSGVLILQPWEAYKPDTSIDLTRHHEPKVLLDKIAYWTVKLLRVPTDIFFQVTPARPSHFLGTSMPVSNKTGQSSFKNKTGQINPEEFYLPE
jgi:hypothetical protein